MNRLLATAVLLVLALAACEAGPREIHAGAEECAHCRMLVSETRFASQLLTDRGRGLVFDSIECMAEFLDEEEDLRVRSLWVTDFERPGTWLPVDEAVFLQSQHLRSPMGLGLSAYADETAASRALREHGGELLDWAGVRALVEVSPVRGGGHGHGH